MFASEFFDFPLWWIFPLVMIILCFLMMRGRMGSLCGRGGHGRGGRHTDSADSALGILDKRYARGEIDRQEYEEKKKLVTQA